MNIIKRPISFLKEVRAELGKVAWSTRQELMDSTIVVIAVTFLTAIFIYLIDFSLLKSLKIIGLLK